MGETAWSMLVSLSNMGGTKVPRSVDSPGALFLFEVSDADLEDCDDDRITEVADGCVPITHAGDHRESCGTVLLGGAMSAFGVCPYCGWLLQHAALRENGGVPYCCAEYEKQGVVLWE